MKYKRFVITPFFDEEFQDFGAEIEDTTRRTVIDPMTAAPTKDEAVEWAKEVCDNRRAHERLCFTV